MKVHRYSRWDGRQEEFSLDARQALDAMSDLLMEGLDVEEALEWMRRYGFQLAGMNMRVMGVQELLGELRERAAGIDLGARRVDGDVVAGLHPPGGPRNHRVGRRDDVV